MLARQKIAFGRLHVGQVIIVHVTTEVITIDLAGEDTWIAHRIITRLAPSMRCSPVPAP